MHTLETPRLLVRPLARTDLDDLHALLDIELQWAGPNVSLESRREKLAVQIALAQWADTGAIYGDRAIVLRNGGVLIGICGFRPWLCTPEQRALYGPPSPHDPSFNSLELGVGYALAARHRGLGYATEAVTALIAYGFTTLGVQRIVALTERGNIASLGVMRRVGMRVGFNPAPDASYPSAVGVIDAEGGRRG